MNRIIRIRLAAVLVTVLLGTSHSQAGLWGRFCSKDRSCEQRCECPCRAEQCCRPVRKKKEHKCCLVGDMPEVAPILRTIVARTVTDAAVRVAPETNPPQLVTRVEPKKDDGTGLQLDQSTGVDTRLDGLEHELEDMSLLIRELTEQLKALETRENKS